MNIYSSGFSPLNLSPFLKKVVQPFTNHKNNSIYPIKISNTDLTKVTSFGTKLSSIQNMQINEKSKLKICSSVDEISTSSIKIELIDLDKVLTLEDKKLLGWPLADDASCSIQQITLFIALDRRDGYLTGPLTMDYLIGNPDKAIAGLCDRNPAITKSDVLQLLKSKKYY